jgi:DNA-binding NarL/FixJ family response regulator
MKTPLTDNYIKTAILLEDHKLFSDAIEKVLIGYGFFDNIMCFTNEQNLLKYLLSKRGSLSNYYLFLDYYVGKNTLPPLFAELRRIIRNPKVIVISGITNTNLLQSLIKYEPRGIIHKTDDIQELRECVIEVMNGNSFFSTRIKGILEEDISGGRKFPFTPREMELLSYFAQGYTIESTASVLNVSPFTIAAHRRKMFSKAKCKNISELLAFARQLDII